MNKYLDLIRPRHYIKNILIFAPMFFGHQLSNLATVLNTFYAFIAFCFSASAIYIVNDLKDIEKDRRHPIKRYRPLASGAVSPKNALVLMLALLVASVSMIAVGIFMDHLKMQALLLLLAYVGINVLYSLWLKNLPVIDVAILAGGYLLRLYYGSCVSCVTVSSWLYLTVLGGAFYLGMGKRRNEIQNVSEGDTRKVLARYNYAFLDKNMHIYVAFTEMSYALWAVQMGNKGLYFSIPLVMLIFMKYSLDIETTASEGNPIDVLTSDKALILLVTLYVIDIFVSIYI